MSQFPCPNCSALIGGDALACRICGYRFQIDKGLAGTESIEGKDRMPQWQVDKIFEQTYGPRKPKKAPKVKKVRTPINWEGTIPEDFEYAPPRGDRRIIFNIYAAVIVIGLLLVSLFASKALQENTNILPGIVMAFCGVFTLIALMSPQLNQDFLLKPFLMWRSFQPYRFIFSGFSHVNFTHLLMNAFSILSFGHFFLESLITYFGDLAPLVFTGFFLISVVIADIPDFIWHRNHPEYASVGASGGGAAIVAATVIFNPDITVYNGFPGIAFVVIYFVVSIVFAFRKNSKLAHLAHATGTAFGLAIALLVTSSSVPNYSYLPAETLSERLSKASGIEWRSDSVEEYSAIGVLSLYYKDECGVWELDSEQNANTQLEELNKDPKFNLNSWMDFEPSLGHWVLIYAPSSEALCAKEAAKAIGWTLTDQ